MTDQLISLETAKLAKEKGFPQSQNAIQYTEDCDHNTGDHGQFIKHSRYTCVTQSLLQKWLREVHKIHIGVKPFYDAKFGIITYAGDILQIGNYIAKNKRLTVQPTYESALEISLIEALKLI